MKLFTNLFNFIWKIGAFAFLGLVAWDVTDAILGETRGPYLNWVIGGAIVGLLISIYGVIK